MTTNNNFRIKNALEVGGSVVVNSSGTWIGSPTGLVGPQGNTGTAATISIGKVSTGSSASVTNTGTAANAYLNFTIPWIQGPQGEPGAQGSTGTFSGTLNQDIDLNAHVLKGGSYAGNTISLPTGFGPIITNGYEDAITLQSSSDNTTFQQWKFRNNGQMVFPSITEQDNWIYENTSTGNFTILGTQQIRINTGVSPVSTWTFDGAGLTFPDLTVQTTAWTGTVAFSSVTDVPSFSTATAVSQLTNDSEYLTSSTVGTYIPSVTPTVQYWTTGTISTASTTTALIALVQDSGMDSASTTSTNNIPAFYDGSVWRYVFNLAPLSLPTSGGGMDTNTILLLHAEDFTDSAGNFTLSTAGNVSISSDQAKFGKSFYFDGSGGQINLAYNAIQEFEAQDFTIEYWLYRNSGTAAGVVPIAGWGGSGGGHSWFIRDGDGGYFIWIDSDGNQTNYNLGMDTTTGVWRHYAMVRNGNTFTAYQDGTQIYTSTMNGSVHTESGTGLFLGYNADAPSNGYFFLNGYIDEVRISKGIARYTANFTPPTAAFTS
jgi:hypothetical protein